MSKVILVDCDPDAYKMHRSNAVGLMKWTGNDDDRSLIDLAAFLRSKYIKNIEFVLLLCSFQMTIQFLTAFIAIIVIIIMCALILVLREPYINGKFQTK